MTYWKVLGLSSVMFGLIACQTVVSQNNTDVTSLAVIGTVAYTERISLPANAKVTVSLVDKKRLGDAAILSQVSFPTGGKQIPFNFSLPYSKAQILPNSDIVVKSDITLENQPMFTTTTDYQVITNEIVDVNVKLTRVTLTQ